MLSLWDKGQIEKLVKEGEEYFNFLGDCLEESKDIENYLRVKWGVRFYFSGQILTLKVRQIKCQSSGRSIYY